MSGGVRNVYVHDCTVTCGDQGIRLKSMRGRGGYVDTVHFENIHLAGLRQEAIVLNMFYGSSTAASRSDAPPAFRNIHVRSLTCDSAGMAAAIRGLPEQPIENVVLEDLHLNAVEGIHCRDARHLTFRSVSGTIEKEPIFSCTNVSGLEVTNMTLTTPERRT
jgi:polygalacturonase